MKSAVAKWMIKGALGFCLTVMVGSFLTLILAETANAIPTFARKYRTSCTTCHIAIPKRNAFGEAFRRNGYRLPVDDEFAVKEDPVTLGAEPWKMVWPRAYWPGAIPGTVPISFYIHQRLVVSEQEGGGDTVNTNFDAPHEFELFTGGTLGSRLSWFGEWIVFERGETDEERLGSLYAQYKILEDVLKFKFGKFDLGGLDGYNAFKEDNRLTISHFGQNDYRVVPSTDKVNGEDIDFRWRLRDRQAGVELNGILADRIEYALGLVNGNGSVSDNNDEKDWYYSVRAKLFGDTMTMKEIGPELLIAENWRDDSVTIGTHGYFGTTTLETDTLTWDNEFRRFGVDLRAKYGRLEVGGAFVWGNDDNPGGPPGLGIADDIDSNAWIVHATYLIFPWLMPVFRYEEVNFDKDFATDTENIVLNLTALHTANIRWTVEWFHFLDDDDGQDTFKANLLFAF